MGGCQVGIAATATTQRKLFATGMQRFCQLVFSFVLEALQELSAEELREKILLLLRALFSGGFH